MKKLRILGNDQRGTAAIEFALISVFLFGTIMVALDFGIYVQQKLRLGSAVEQGAVLAYNRQVGATTTAISDYVRTYAGTTTQPSVSITCNGTNTCGDGKCSCISSTGGFTIVGTCNATCSGSSAVSGNYLKIVASTTYTAILVPDRYLGGSTLAQSAVVRLQ